MAERFNEDQFHTLWADGLDPLTSAAASYESGDEPQPASRSNRCYYDLGLIAGLVLYVAWQLW